MIKALKTAWGFYSSIITLLLLLLLLLPGEFLLNKTPVCRSIAEDGISCSACGLSNGFVSLAGGNITEAQNFNFYSLPLFIIFVTNSLIFIFFISDKFLTKKLKILNSKGNKLWQKLV